MNKLSIISIIFSITGIILIVRGQYYLGIAYEFADGKTQALYGLKTLDELKLIGFGLIGLFLSIVSAIKKEQRNRVLLTSIIALVAVTLPFLNLWQIWK
ncbi:hypothetical protein [Fulvivirga lutea]|uniref:DUF3784 domain-containing protein n=1 Tax=Fulvivirga lutea TaxID=2810512 RepID=A0A975A211_9BACT|nr:hypothetical protein [Fulvivirga lutea]QSE98994.1 hypothetical protein JR347_07885 [Fulvivirga lutea]